MAGRVPSDALANIVNGGRPPAKQRRLPGTFRPSWKHPLVRKCLLALLLTLPLSADTSWKIDVNQDGKPDTVRLVPADPGHDAVVVEGLWRSPDGLSDAGESLAGVGDVDADGRVELLFSEATRGGPPDNYAFFPWTGEGFDWRSQRPAPLFEKASGRFEWSDHVRRGRFLTLRKVLSPGLVLAEVHRYAANGPDDFAGRAELRYADHGFTVERWTVPFHRAAEVPDRILSIGLGSALRDSDLAPLSARELTLARNAIYARHGRRFNDARLRDYFRQQPWYREDRNYSDDFVPPEEQANASFIADYQRRTGKSW